MDTTVLILIVLLSFSISLISAMLFSRFGHLLFLLDRPNERSSHSSPTPRGGGIGIWLVFTIIGTFITKDVVFSLIAGTIGLLGFLEDRFEFSSQKRLLAQFAVSALTAYYVVGLPSSGMALALFLFWMVFITGTLNFYNFMDGINGIAALSGIVGFGFMIFFSMFINIKPDVALMSIALVSGCLGFLPFNFPKAKVFMGDVGSVFLGFIFAFFVLKLSASLSMFLCLIMFLCTFYADTVITIFYRWKNREPLMKAHRHHLYQYMSNELGLAHWKVSLIYVATQSIFGILSLQAYKRGLIWQFALIIIFTSLFVISYKIIKRIRHV